MTFWKYIWESILSFGLIVSSSDKYKQTTFHLIVRLTLENSFGHPRSPAHIMHTEGGLVFILVQIPSVVKKMI